MTLSSSYHLEKLPAAPQTVHFDNHAFDLRPNHPVEAVYAGHDEWRSAGISFQDYGSMQTQRKKMFPSRRFKTPDWAINTEDLQSVIVHFLENRAFSRQWRLTGCSERLPMKTRLLRAEVALQAKIPGLERVIDSLCTEYCDLKCAGVNPARLEVLEQEIATYDTQIITSRTPALVVAAVIYMYYREGRNSPEIAQALRIRAPHVRQMLFRIWGIARQLGFPAPEREYRRKNDGRVRQARYRARKEAITAS